MSGLLWAFFECLGFLRVMGSDDELMRLDDELEQEDDLSAAGLAFNINLALDIG